MADIAELGVSVDTSGLKRGERAMGDFVREGGRTEQGINKSTENMSRGFGALGGAIGAAGGLLATLGVGFSMVSAVQQVAAFQDATNGLRAVSGATGEALASLEGQARRLGATTIYSATQVANAQQFLAQAGFDADQILQSTAKTLELATAGNLDLARSADIATNVMGGMRLEVAELGRVTDVLAATASGSNTNITQLGDALSYAAPVAASAGISIEQLSAAVGVLGDAGLQGSRAGTAMLGLIRQLSNATPAAQEALSRYGLTLQDVSIEQHGLVNVLHTLRQANIGTADSFTIFGSEVAPAVGILTSGAERVREFADSLESAGGSAARMAADMSTGLTPAFKSLGSAVSETVLQMGDSGLAGALEQSIVGITGVISSLNGMGAEFAESNKLTAEAAANYETAATALAAVGGAVGAATAGYVAYRTAVGLATVAQIAFNTAARANPYMLLITGAVAAAGALYTLSKRMETSEERLDAVHAAAERYKKAVDTIGTAEREAAIASNAAEIQRLENLSNVNALVEQRAFRFAEADKLEAMGAHAAAAAQRRLADQISERIAQSGDYAEALAAAKAERDRLTGAEKEAVDATEAAATAEETHNEAVQKILAGLIEKAATINMTAAEQARYNVLLAGGTTEEANHAAQLVLGTAAAEGYAHAVKNAADELERRKKEMEDFASGVKDTIDPLRLVAREMEQVWAAFDAGSLTGDEVIDYIDTIAERLNDVATMEINNPFEKWAGSIRQTATAMQGMYQQGSRGYQNMAVAIQAANVVSAIGAVLTQGMGDPYTAPARMAAMAVTVAGLGYSVGSLGGSAPDDAAARQAMQGTGTVFGDSLAKSESIAAAVEITADASKELVGLNRGMLQALQAMQAGISGASVRIAQGAAGASYDYGGGLAAIATPQNIFDKSSEIISGSAIGVMDGLTTAIFKWGASILGGKSKVTDQGVEIIGGTMAEMIENTMLRGYETTRTKKYRWSSWDEHTGYADFVDDEVGRQFGAVFNQLAESVYQGGIALGLAGDEVADSINSFVIETQKISLKGLTAEEQSAEIEAVFSSIFDNLAGAAVEWLPNFVEAGEGLGETLARVATQVQVTEEAVFRLGFAAERTSAEQFARLSDNLIKAAGGIEQFISGMSSFVDKFAPEAHKFDLLSADMTRSLEAVGLAVPETRDGMWDLMQSLDAATEVGAKQITTLLELTKTSDAYYKELERQHKAFFGGLMSDLERAVAAERNAISEAYRKQQETIRASINRTTESIGKLERFSQSLRQTMQSLRAEDEAQRLDRRMQAQAELTTALAIARAGGPLPLDGELDDALAAIAEPSEDLYSDFVSYARAQGIAAQTLNDLDKLGQHSLSVEQRTLRQLESAEQAAQQQHDAEIARLDDILSDARAQYNALLGIDDSVQSVYRAIMGLNLNGLNLDSKDNEFTTADIEHWLKDRPLATAGEIYDAMDQYKVSAEQLAAATGWTVDEIMQAYNDVSMGINKNIVAQHKFNSGSPEAPPPAATHEEILWRINHTLEKYGSFTDEANLELYNYAKQFGVPLLTVEQYIPGAINWVQSQGLPMFANGGIHEGGLAMVGERGPELIHTGGQAQVYSSAQTRGLLDTSELVRELQEMRKQNAELMKQLLMKVSTVEADTRTIRNIKREEMSE